jgi:hypothetical protein
MHFRNSISLSLPTPCPNPTFHLVLFHLHALPSPVVDIHLQLPSNQALNSMFEPHFSQQRIIPLLVEEELMVSSQRGINLTVLVEVRRNSPTTVIEIEVEKHTFAYVDEKADIATASVKCVNEF